MKYDSATGKIEKTAEDAARQERVRQQLVREPSREELEASGDFVPVGTMESYVALRRLQRRLRELREEAGLAAAELARRSGLKPEVVEQIEGGLVADLSLSLIHRYAACLGKHIELEVTDLQTQP